MLGFGHGIIIRYASAARSNFYALIKLIRSREVISHSVPTSNSSMAQDPSQEKINVYFKVTKTLAMEVNKTDTVRDVKAMLADKEGILQVLQQLSFDGNRMDDGCRFFDYGVINNSTINLSSLAVKLHVKIVSTQKTIVIDAKRSDSIQNVKSLIESTERIRPVEYTLYHDGKLLEDGISLTSLNLQRDSNFQLVPCPRDVLWILVTAPDRETKRLQVMMLHTVFQVKRLAENVMKLVPGNWQVFDGRIRLEESKTLAYYEIKENAVLTMQDSNSQSDPYPRELLWISVKAPERETKRLEVKILHTVGEVKRLAENVMNLPPGNWHILEGGSRLEESKTLAYHEIKENAVLTMRCAFQIFVKTWSRETFVLEVSKLDTISDVKHLISVKTSVPTNRLWLIYAGKALTGDRDVASYNIQKDSTLFVNLRV